MPSLKGSPYARRSDVESGSSNSGDAEEEDLSNPFEIHTTKHASVDRLRRWRVRFCFFFFLFALIFRFLNMIDSLLFSILFLEISLEFFPPLFVCVYVLDIIQFEFLLPFPAFLFCFYFGYVWFFFLLLCFRLTLELTFYVYNIQDWSCFVVIFVGNL